jgi:nucleosome assembly protein 1-like 1
MTDAIPDEIMGSIETLRSLDDVYGRMEQELRDKITALQKEYQPKLNAILKDRTTELSKTHAASKDAKATPAVPRFWLDVLLASDEFGEVIQEYDEPVLEYLESIETSDIDPADEDKGFILTFKFNPNPFFKNTELRKIYTLRRANEFTDQLEITRIESDEIEWNDGKNVTVELVSKKKSGGGARKKKAAKEEPRPSFFRFYRTIDEDNLPSELGDYEEDEEEDDMEDHTMDHLQMIMQDDWESAVALKDLVVPRAIRWYTGEAVDEEVEDDEEDDDDDDDDDYEDEEDDDEDEEEKGSPKNLFPAKKTGASANPEECKQQ